MKRTIACLLIILLLVMLAPSVTEALDVGELEIVTEPETIVGEVDQVISVNFYLYPNLPQNLLLNSIQGVLQYDADMLAFGAIILKDEEHNLISFMESGKNSTMPAVNTNTPGEIRFAYIDVYGWKDQGFWLQIEFRIKQTGASALVFNSVRYSGYDPDAVKSTSFYINPIQAGAIMTEGETAPTDAAASMTYEPLVPEVEVTPTPGPTPTPKLPDSGKTVPKTTDLPVPSGITSGSPGIVTPNPPVTSMPVTTSSWSSNSSTEGPNASAGADATAAPGTNEDPSGTNETDPSGVTTDPVADASPNADPNGGTAAETKQPENVKLDTEETAPSNLALTIAVLAGIVVVVLLAVLAIVLIIVRKKRMDAEEDGETEEEEDDEI